MNLPAKKDSILVRGIANQRITTQKPSRREACAGLEIALAACSARSGRHVLSESSLDSHVLRLKRWSAEGILPGASPMNWLNAVVGRIGTRHDPVDEHQWLGLVVSVGAIGRSGRLLLTTRLVAIAHFATQTALAAAALMHGLRLNAVSSCDRSHRSRLK